MKKSLSLFLAILLVITAAMTMIGLVSCADGGSNNGGNSGGPLVNEKFQVVGVNTFKMKAEYAEGCFYSVTVETIKLAFPELWQKISGK